MGDRAEFGAAGYFSRTEDDLMADETTIQDKSCLDGPMTRPAASGDFHFRYSFSCTQCGQCCRWPGYVLLSDADISRMSRALDIEETAFIADYTRLASNRRELSLNDKEDGSCVFLDGDRCRIYEDRPDQCRSFPFAHTSAQECPGLQVEWVPRSSLD